MKRFFAIAPAMLLSSALFFAAADTGAGVTKPYKAKWTGTDYTAGFCPETFEPLVVNIGKGIGTITGESDFISVGCVDCTDFPMCTSSGWTIVTAANGDTIHLRIEGEINMDDGSWLEREWGVGGTGRFDGATGYSETYGNYIFPTDPDLFPFDADPPIPPPLLQAPAFWVGTTKGEITFP